MKRKVHLLLMIHHLNHSIHTTQSDGYLCSIWQRACLVEERGIEGRERSGWAVEVGENVTVDWVVSVVEDGRVDKERGAKREEMNCIGVCGCGGCGCDGCGCGGGECVVWVCGEEEEEIEGEREGGKEEIEDDEDEEEEEKGEREDDGEGKGNGEEIEEGEKRKGWMRETSEEKEEWEMEKEAGIGEWALWRRLFGVEKRGKERMAG
ncbi:uncharacterized protein MONOS_773 [Monocercomonoides exilis]|uniref:uncharacterized protein n=1 Tax=Monocercomonoides exilis TaxID=2049356 RepID=UPI003559B996|nr:hypothetical protein MONOS_773 [Monocercomonoides exilis]|eukprot:MONOS_773.1-p1 / transcript=MONOS_773.1 / gene=MONOS_773 / organism=Monocercomonoides_exilis_PA203 / gene_product=unspecified product / transcript_product=unspecified product / location=Mono_scaffold00013:67712-68517(+) / protein_length=207 / sequence_SO=supercontig / SO=protein_coding / is_pseudo=false